MAAPRAVIAVVVWLWQEGFRDYGPQHVNTLARVIRRRLALPHRFVCVSDKPDGLEEHVEWFKTPVKARAWGHLRNPDGDRFPSCFRRLWMFSEEAAVLGDRLLLLDIDVIATNELSHLFGFREDFVGWRPMANWGNDRRYGGGSYLLTPGTRKHVWEQFQGAPSIAAARVAGFRGSDQAWLSYALGAGETVWPPEAGVISIRDLRNGQLPLPAQACLVHFNGPQKPWTSTLPWVLDHWR